MRHVNHNFLRYTTLAVGLIVSQFSLAADVKFGGFADMYYQYNLNTPGFSAAPTAAAPNPAGPTTTQPYSSYNNQITVNFVELNAKKTGSEVGYLADFDFGQVADTNSAAATGGTDELTKHVGQAYLTYAPSGVSGLKFAIGKMATHMGVESYKAQQSWNYSRSNTFAFGLPRWHTGASVGYAFSPDKFEGTLYYYNGWNTVYRTQASPTLGIKLAFPNAMDKIDVTVNGMFGPATPTAAGELKKTVGEVIAMYKYDHDTSYGFTFMYTKGKGFGATGANLANAKYWGAGLYHKCKVYNKATIAPRFTIYDDPDGFTTGTGQSIKSATLTYNYALGEGLDFRAEARYDWSSQAVFSKGGTPVAFAKNDTTVTLAALYGF